ncbi:MAG: type IV pilin protein [Desulfovibrionaceae bacterium]|nr:type IV pilin protein [Desulfovibrionaceae bacterium]
MEYLRRGYRAEARAGLLQAAQWMERAATATGTYPLTAGFPTGLTTVPSQKYNISITSTDGLAFQLTATPSGWSDAKCGNYTLDQTGLRGANGATAGQVILDCWGK